MLREKFLNDTKDFFDQGLVEELYATDEFSILKVAKTHYGITTYNTEDPNCRYQKAVYIPTSVLKSMIDYIYNSNETEIVSFHKRCLWMFKEDFHFFTPSEMQIMKRELYVSTKISNPPLSQIDAKCEKALISAKKNINDDNSNLKGGRGR